MLIDASRYPGCSVTHQVSAIKNREQGIRRPGRAAVTNTGVMQIFIALVEAIGENGLKATATGNLPLKFCKALAQQLREKEDENDTLLLLIGDYLQ